MSTFTPDLERDTSRVLDYWFGPPAPTQRWFAGGPDLDAEITAQFAPLASLAAAAQLPTWPATPRSALALVILLDQFPRHIHRASPLAYAADGRALDATLDAIARGDDRRLPLLQSAFFYLPLMHAETLVGQVAGMALLEGLQGRCVAAGDEETAQFVAKSWEFARRHLEAVKRFGRFPSRNEVLGRQSTEEELRFLKEHPSGF
jgi:uncharacterized protein (DUF924 family)